MGTIRLFAIVVAGFGMLAACQTPAEPAPEISPAVEAATGEAETAMACAVIESSGWEAFINRMPGVDAKPTITVVGKVTVPTSGYEFNWQEGPLDRSAMPVLMLKLEPVAPDGISLPALTTEQVVYKADALPNGYRGVKVFCGGELLAEITDILEVS